MKKLALFLCLLWPQIMQGHVGGHYAKGDLMKIKSFQRPLQMPGGPL